MSDRAEAVRRLKNVLDGLRPVPGSQPFYDMLSDALVWPDEVPDAGPADRWWAARYLFRHRTCLLLGLTSQYAELWDLGLRTFPHWPGFEPDRCTPSATLRDLYETSRARACNPDALRQLRQVMRQLRSRP